VPDIIACLDGNFIAIEVKAGSNKTTVLQEFNLSAIRKAGGIAAAVYSLREAMEYIGMNVAKIHGLAEAHQLIESELKG
jgi:Holliday junction resolvase